MQVELYSIDISENREAVSALLGAGTAAAEAIRMNDRDRKPTIDRR